MILLMETLLICVSLAILGAILGSFASASVWRLRARQLRDDKAAGEKIDTKEYTRLKPLLSPVRQDRSRCLSCGHELSAKDLLPGISWLMLKGKCRYCQAPIGYEPLVSELGLAAFFVVSYVVWPVVLIGAEPWLQFGLWLAAGVLLLILFLYDMRWYILPDSAVFGLIGLGAVATIARLTTVPDVGASLLSLLGAVILLSGLYLFIYVISRGGWIGFGDVKLGLGMALLLGDWALGFIALFSANLIGCLVVIPALSKGKLTRQSRVPFGPFLIAGFVVAGLAGDLIITGYMKLIGF